ncbi:hypothetical protein Ocin01_06118 [Orchesella cincta]|uniref:Uncharacterized protein n=1 Tax=Orchesella cincta TaxID=48709 RepID=A0A1D2N5L3_ORCCI|nr:hypothetical protein Ocin01_06118 [Orchesella cincta]
MANVSNMSRILLIIVVVKVCSCNAWLLPWKADETDTIVKSNVESIPDKSTSNTELIDDEVFELEETENEVNPRCLQDFNKNLYKVLRSFMPINATDRFGRQEDTDELVSSLLNLEFPQIFVPVLKLVGSAAANNATAIDETYNSLPYAVRSQVTDLIQFVADVITTT